MGLAEREARYFTENISVSSSGWVSKNQCSAQIMKASLLKFFALGKTPGDNPRGSVV